MGLWLLTFGPLCSLGLHLLDHGFRHRDDFNKKFNVSIIDDSSPKTWVLLTFYNLFPIHDSKCRRHKRVKDRG